MKVALDHAKLKAKQRAIRNGFPETMGLRVHRAISWIGRAESCGGDHDARFLFLWIAFNAAYADEREFQGPAPTASERNAFLRFFGQIAAQDASRRVYDALWQKFPGPVRIIMENRFVFNPFWQHQNGIAGHADWAERFRASTYAFHRAFEAGDTVRVLCFLFDRLYVLRNQLVHGGATWNSAVNREQVRDGAAILATLMPLFVDIMMDAPEADWGRPFYPVLE
jgi:hypothetical protein